RQDYIDLINKIKCRIPLIAITTDVLVGFPSETESDFKETVSLIKQVIPLKTHIFPYSSREGTLAAKKFKNRLNPVLVKERMNYLSKIADACSLKYRKQFLHKRLEVLIEDKAYKQTGFWQGYTSNYMKLLVKSAGIAKNTLLAVRIKEVLKDYSLAQKTF
ncbi:MAG: tRNA (N(6)-L-threonylcarbamoyladenosine(37)-C(2))-methylthiotransferase MtaB, partial [Candidatus Omnitrophota bacterium]